MSTPTPSPFAELMRQRREEARQDGRKRPPGRPRLSDEQREARKKVASMVRQRAYAVLIARHRDEWNALQRAERAALYEAIDALYAAGVRDIDVRSL